MRSSPLLARLSATALPALAVAASAACIPLPDGGDDGEGGAPPAPNAYAVDGKLESNTCGKGSLALEDAWRFEVTLEIDGRNIRWADTQGELSEDGRGFAFRAEADFDMRSPEDDYKPPCTIRRIDVVTGELDDASDPSGFSGTFDIRYEPTEGSDCLDLLEGPERLAALLPCAARYDLAAERK